jgi:hypothetical protein
VQGAASRTTTPTEATDITARLLAIAIHVGKAGASAVVVLTVAARMALAQSTDPDQPEHPDPLPVCARLIRDTYTRDLPADVATRLVISVFSTHSRGDRHAVVQALIE